MHPLSFRGLAFATSFSAILNMAILFFTLDKRIGPFDKKDLSNSFLKILFTSLLMGILLQIFLYLYAVNLDKGRLIQKAILVVLMLAISLLSYVSLASLFKIREVKRVLGILGFKR